VKEALFAAHHVPISRRRPSDILTGNLQSRESAAANHRVVSPATEASTQLRGIGVILPQTDRRTQTGSSSAERFGGVRVELETIDSLDEDSFAQYRRFAANIGRFSVSCPATRVGQPSEWADDFASVIANSERRRP
jgi:hypothetical protein